MTRMKWTFAAPTTLVAASVGALFLSACTPTAPEAACPVPDDVGNLENGIIGLTVNELGMPLPGARVFIPGEAVDLVTDANGRFSIAYSSLKNPTNVMLQAELEGYPDKVQRVSAPSDHITDVALVMKPYSATDGVLAEVGGTVSAGPARVTFEPGAFVYVDDGTKVVGDVEISIVTYRPDVVEDMRSTPGALMGSSVRATPLGGWEIDPDGNLDDEPIRTYGMVDVGMWQGARRVELAEGKPAFVELIDIVEGEHNEDAIAAFNDQYRDQLPGNVEPSIPLWHFNYDTAAWDFVDGYSWDYKQTTAGAFDQGGRLSISTYVPAFSPANPDLPVVTCTNSIDIESPIETCVCRNVKHANDTENVRGADMTLFSRAPAYTYLVVTCSNGTSTRTLVNITWQSFLDRTRTDNLGNFCGRAILDPKTQRGSVRIDSTKTYWPGRLDDTDKQYKDVDGDRSLDDNKDGKIDAENQIGFLGDTYFDNWTQALNGQTACGTPNVNLPSNVLHVKCINGPVDPVTGQVYP